MADHAKSAGQSKQEVDISGGRWEKEDGKSKDNQTLEVDLITFST